MNILILLRIIFLFQPRKRRDILPLLPAPLSNLAPSLRFRRLLILTRKLLRALNTQVLQHEEVVVLVSLKVLDRLTARRQSSHSCLRVLPVFY